mgnify:FL=1
MGRRASSSLNTTAIVGIAVGVLFLIVAGALVLRKGRGETFDAPPLPMEEVYSNANSLRGNEYTVEGTVDRREPRDSGLGISIVVDSDGEKLPLFIIVPDDVATINIERDVAYAFKVRFGEGGVPIATGVKRL